MTVSVGGMEMTFKATGLSAITGPGIVALQEALPAAVPSGTPVRSIVVLNDVASQRTMGRIEVDENGNPTDGVHEYFVNDSSLTTITQQINRARAELELFAWPIVTVTYATRDPNTRPGRQVHFDLSDPPIRGDFLIQEVTIDQVHDESDTLSPRYTARASSVRFDLEDLLLMIAEGGNAGMFSPGTNNAGVSSAGLVESAVSQAADATPAIVDARLTALGISAGGFELKSAEFTINTAEWDTLDTIPKVIITGIAGKMFIPISWAANTEKNTGAWAISDVSLKAQYTGNTISLLNTLQTQLGSGVAGDTYSQALAVTSSFTPGGFDPVGKSLEVISTNGSISSGGTRTATTTGVILYWEYTPPA